MGAHTPQFRRQGREPAGTPTDVIPAHWQAVRRPDDAELVGYLVADAGSGSVPTTLVGTALSGPLPADDARSTLVERGLPALDRRWWCRLPTPLPRGLLAGHEPADDWDWRPVLIVEAGPSGVRVRPEWAEPHETAALVALPVPVGGLLLTDPPG